MAYFATNRIEDTSSSDELVPGLEDSGAFHGVCMHRSGFIQTTSRTLQKGHLGVPEHGSAGIIENASVFHFLRCQKTKEKRQL